MIDIANEDIVLSVECAEGKHIVNHEVWLMPYSIENLGRLWEASKEHRVLFSDDVAGDFHSFCEVFFTQDFSGNIHAKGLTWIVDDFLGAFFMNRITLREANVDFSFFDGRLRSDLTRAMIKYVFNKYEFWRLNVEIATYANQRVFKFVEDLGFRREGKKRNAISYYNAKCDLVLYGLLREEVKPL